jgi:hypothetical protein
MKKLIAITTFDKNGILDGIQVIDSIYQPDEVTIGDETIKITGRGVSELLELPKIVFDVRDVKGFTNEEVPKLSLPATESRIARVKLSIRNKLSDYFMNKEASTATSLR